MPFKDLEFHSQENPDWGFARNQRSVLMVPSAEWVQSISSCQFRLNEKTFVTPNRDYPYEGLMVYQDGENWKFIDCIAVGLRSQAGEYLPFIEDSLWLRVRLNPWKVRYCYKSVATKIDGGKQEIPFSIAYYLHCASSPEAITGCVEIAFSEEFGSAGFTPIIQPFVDIRHMYGNSDLDNCKLKFSHESPEQIHIENHNRVLTFYLQSGKVNLFGKPEILNWKYKLGVGERVESIHQHAQATVFTSEERNVAAFFNLELPAFSKAGCARLFFSCGLAYTRATVVSPEEIDKTSEYLDYNQLREIEQTFHFSEGLVYRDALLARIVGLTKFKVYLPCSDDKQYVRVPCAGAWWFKTPWYRDIFEGILSSFRTLMALQEERKNIKNVISIAFSTQDSITGLIPNRIPEFKNMELPYNSSDATLLCFLAAYAYLQEIEDADFEGEVIQSAMKTVVGFCRFDDQLLPDSPPRVDRASGLILSAPHHSWIDTRSQSIEIQTRRIEHLPSRASAAFIEALCGHVANEATVGTLLSSPCFFLPEINAQWIVMLRGTLRTIDRLLARLPAWTTAIEELKEFKNTASSLLSLAEQNFLSVFWNEKNGFLFNLVYENGEVKDRIEGEPGVVAIALLGEILFTRKHLRAVWECVRTKLLVHRRLVYYGDKTLPFGILTKNEDQRVFYNDRQYHSDVVWLRSTPYLIKLLCMLGMKQTAKEVLINTLDHQMTEGALFYNQELFSRPFGNNPSPDQRTRNNPVPVKNPIQFWSQWCDPMLDAFEKEGATK